MVLAFWTYRSTPVFSIIQKVQVRGEADLATNGNIKGGCVLHFASCILSHLSRRSEQKRKPAADSTVSQATRRFHRQPRLTDDTNNLFLRSSRRFYPFSIPEQENKRILKVEVEVKVIEFNQVLASAGGSLAARAAAAIPQFDGNQLASSIHDTIDDFKKNDRLGAALDRAVSTTSDVLKDIIGSAKKIAPATDYIVVETTRLHEEKIRPALAEAGNALSGFHEGSLKPGLVRTGSAVEEFGREKLTPAIHNAGRFAKEHPAETAVIVGSGLTFAFPYLISAPILWISGWGGRGVRAGSSAAALQSIYGDVVARGAFATVQSSAMGGYGAVVVNGIVRAGGAILGTVVFGEAVGEVVHEKPKDEVVVIKVDPEHGKMKAWSDDV